MSEPLENQYFNWLYSQVCDIHARTPQLQYKNLLRTLHKSEFVWLILGDDNRAEEGCELRREFAALSGAEPDDIWMAESCSVLEMLIAFSRHAGFQTDKDPSEWFWIMLNNLGLGESNDAKRHNESYICDTVDRLVWRTYDFTGHGGLFPLADAQVDQRTIEIWYQFAAYTFEKHFS